MKLNRRIITAMVAVLLLFIAMVVYLTYFAIAVAPKVAADVRNPSTKAATRKILRGRIYARDGETLLAESNWVEGEKGIQERTYPQGSLYAHSVGFMRNTLPEAGVEKYCNKLLTSAPSLIDKVKYEMDDDEGEKGANMVLTLDHGLTKLAAEQLSEKMKTYGASAGSVVALNPKTGEIYCMYSCPTFDPSKEYISDKYLDLMTDEENTPLLFRALNGKYAPGSTFKVVTATAGIDSGNGNFTVEDSGSVKIGGTTIRNAGGGAYGDTDMRLAVKKSSNVYFSQLAVEIDRDSYQKKMERFLLTDSIKIGLGDEPENETSTASIATDDGKEIPVKEIDDVQLANTGYGQGELSVTPMHMAMVAATIANDGNMVQPYIVAKTFHDGGGSEEVDTEKDVKVLSSVTSASTAQTVNSYMTGVTSGGGTGTSAAVSGITVAGKTGTAQSGNPKGDHLWFIGFAPAENPQIAFSVMLEYADSGGGGTACGPIARKLVEYARDNGLISN